MKKEPKRLFFHGHTAEVSNIYNINRKKSRGSIKKSLP